MENVELIISKWAKDNKLSEKQQKPLLEAYRRVFLLKPSETEMLNSPLVLPCSPSVVKPAQDYFIRPQRETPRVYNWYALSSLGKITVSNLADEFVGFTNKDKLNLYLFNRQ